MAFWQTDDGTRINYEFRRNHGGSAVLLLLHGLLGSGNNHWGDFIDPLLTDFQLIVVDLRGHGSSENKQNTLNPDRLRRDVKGLLEHLQIERLHIAGYDFGGYLGLMLMLHHSELVESLLMHATKFYWPEHTMVRMIRNLDPDLMSSKFPGYASRLVIEHGASRWRTLVRQTADLVTYISKSGITENMVRLAAQPVLVSVGDRDEIVPVREAMRLSSTLPRGALLVVPGLSHSIHAPQTTLLLTAMRSFFGQAESSTAKTLSR